MGPGSRAAGRTWSPWCSSRPRAHRRPPSEKLVQGIVVYPKGPGYSPDWLRYRGHQRRLEVVATGRTTSATSTVPEGHRPAADGADGFKVWSAAGLLVRTTSPDARTPGRISSGGGLFAAASHGPACMRLFRSGHPRLGHGSPQLIVRGRAQRWEHDHRGCDKQGPANSTPLPNIAASEGHVCKTSVRSGPPAVASRTRAVGGW